ncbi:capreomycidine synthase-like [Bactrocera neohumeralis]|uniref:capreomycidine synthase-like n=1 Tax=Bactrocera neohumeralis TaxID=98809 RepID=UPI00216620C1|nr:capreomycidine synthase-like [Bactrocera neohumeralis]
MKIDAFDVERWMDRYELQAKYNLGETCVASITIEELLEIAGKSKESLLAELLPMRMTYGAIKGSSHLRAGIARLYSNQTEDNILVTHGTIGANSLVYETIVCPGDHVIAVLPTYQQHQSIPKCYGAEVEFLHLRPENLFLPDLAELERKLRPNTKLIALNNPNNPTGSLMDEAFLRRIVDIAKKSGAYILCDEVYRGLNDVDQGTGFKKSFTTSIVDLYDKGISTASMSKTFSLAGLRLGWIASNLPEFLDSVVMHRDYNTISVGMLDDYFAAMALDAVDKVMARSLELTRKHRAILDEWVRQEPSVSYLRPAAARRPSSSSLSAASTRGISA